MNVLVVLICLMKKFNAQEHLFDDYPGGTAVGAELSLSDALDLHTRFVFR